MQIDLANYSELMIRQRVERLEAITGFETANRYTVMTPQGEELFYAQEESGTVSRIFLKSHRPLTSVYQRPFRERRAGRQPELFLVLRPSPR